MDISECDTSLGLEHKMKKRKLEQFDNAPEDNNTVSVHPGSEDVSSMDNTLWENYPAPDATVTKCSKLESETGQTHPEICNPKGNGHGKVHDDGQKLLEDIDTELGNINGSGNLILNTADVIQTVTRFSVDMEQPSSTNAFKEISRISEDPCDMRDQDDNGDVANVSQEPRKEMMDVRKDDHSGEKFSSYHLPFNEQEYEGDVSLKSSDIEEPSSTNAYKEDSARIFEDPGDTRDHDDHGDVANVSQEPSKEMMDVRKDDHSGEKSSGSGYHLPFNEQGYEGDGSLKSSDIEEPSSTNAYKEDSAGISEDPGDTRDHDDHGDVANVSQEPSKEMMDVRNDDHSGEKSSGSGYHLPFNEQEYEGDGSLKSSDIEEPSSTNTCNEDSTGISEDPGDTRDHDDHDDHGDVINVSQEPSKERMDVNQDDHFGEKFSSSGYHLPFNEEECERDGSLKRSDIEQITCDNNALEKIVEGAVEEAFVCCSISGHDDETSTSKERIISTSSCMPLELENAETVKEEVVCFSASGETSSGVDAFNEEKTPSQVLDTSEKGDSVGCSRKKLLVLDVNGLLADFICYVPYGYKPDIIIGKKAVFKRPFCDDFIKFCFERFEVGVWSSRTRRNVDMVIDFLMGEFRRKLLFCWDQSHCTDTTFSTVENMHKPLVLKEIRKLWKYLKPREFNASNTLMLDDSPHKALCNPANTAIFPVTYRFRDTDDTSLGPGGDLRVFLEGLSMAENVQKYVEQNRFGQRPITEKNPSWKFYRRIIYFVERRNDQEDNNSFKWN